jgi:ATP-dependent Clp protease ATP-binding subunit ClpX
LEFTPEALVAVAQEAIKRKTGARGLRAILEDVMLETMFDIPGQRNVKQIVVTPECIQHGALPQRIFLSPEELLQRQEQRSRTPQSSHSPGLSGGSTSVGKTKSSAKK